MPSWSCEARQASERRRCSGTSPGRHRDSVWRRSRAWRRRWSSRSPGSARRRPRRCRRRRDGWLLRRPPARRFPGVEVTLVDVDVSRAEVAAALGARFARPDDAAAVATWSCIRARRPPAFSARSTCSRPRARCSSSAGTATPRCGSRWAARSTRAALGCAPARSGRYPRPGARRRTTADRLALALELLRDPAFDVIVTGESRFDELPGVMERLASGSLPALCHTITYDGA